MQQHLLLVSTLTIPVNASSRWGASSRSSRHPNDADWRIDFHNKNYDDESDLGNKETDFIAFLEEGKERRHLGHDLGFGDNRGRRRSKRSSSYSGDNIFDHGNNGKGSSSSHYSYSYKSSKKSGKGSGKGGEWGGYDSNDGGNGGNTAPPPTPQPTAAATTLSPTAPPPSTASPTLPLIQTPSPTQESQKEIPTPPPAGRPTPLPRTPSPTATATPNRNCVVNRDGLFGAQIGVAEVIPFAYELIVFGTPTTEQQISMISTMEEGISNAIIPELFDACSSTSASGSWSDNREVPQEEGEETVTEEEKPERHHFHTGSGLFPQMTTTTTTAQTEESRHQSHSGGGGSFTTTASLEWERRHNHNRDGGRLLQQTRLTGLSSRPKDQIVDASCSGSSLGFVCFPVGGQLTVYSQSRLGQFAIEAIKDSLERAISTGNLQNLDNRILGINHRDLETNPFPDSIDETLLPTFSPTFSPFRPDPTGNDSDLPLPLWAIITIAAAGVLLIFVLGLIWCLRRRNNRQYASNLSNRPASSNIGEIKRPITKTGPNYKPPPSNLNNNAFGRPDRPANALNNSATQPQGSPSNNSFGPPNPHPSTRDFGLPNPHPSPIRPPVSFGVGGTQSQVDGGRQKRPGSMKNSNTLGAASSTPTNTRPSSVQGSGSFGDSSKDPNANAARKAAYGLGPIKSPMANKNAFKLPISIPSGRPDALSVFSGVNSVSGNDRKSISGAQSVDGGDPSRRSTKARPIRSANSVSAAGGSRVEIEMPTSEDESGEESGSGSGSGSDESEENVSLSSSERRNAANKFGDPENAFGDADNAFGIGMTPTEVERFSSSSSYEEEVDEEYEIEYVEDDEEDGDEVFLSSSADEEFWDDEVVEEVVDDPDQPILANNTSSS